MNPRFDLQGHRGARGLRPENTLPGFELALDLMVTSLETDLHRTKDGVLVLHHDEALSERLTRRLDGASSPFAQRTLIANLTRAELHTYLVDRNPDAARFTQANPVTPLTQNYERETKLRPYAIPTLEELLGFVAAYAGEPGRAAGKTKAQRDHARRVRFNLELKRVPFRPEFIGDGLDGEVGGDMEAKLVDAVDRAGVVDRTTVQSFDHRSLQLLRKREPKLAAAALIANTAPASVPQLVRAADAQVYSPDFQFLDQRQIKQAHDAGVRVIPYTVNDPADMSRLLDWQVDGIITDYPDRLIPLLQARHIVF